MFERRPCPVSFASLASMKAGVAAVRGDRAEAVRQIEDLAENEADEVWLASRCARWVLARMRGEEGESAAREASAELASRGVKMCGRLAATQLPGVERYLPNVTACEDELSQASLGEGGRA
jgi:hypothetical protein